MPIPARLDGPASAPPALTPRPTPPTPTSIEAESSGRTLRPLQEVVQERRKPDRGPVLPWPELTRKLPVRLDG